MSSKGEDMNGLPFFLFSSLIEVDRAMVLFRSIPPID